MALQNDLLTSADPAAQPLPNGVHDDLVRQLADSTHAQIDRLAAALESGADAFVHKQEEWLTSARDTVREHPLAAVGVAALAGVLIARLMRSRS